ncbi:MAG: gamma-glutamylcyclotransferase [Gammaproteobacteria bacterium]|nr:gamma-glutamylcyclotransferase [Gammaproteobacteria bacterium]
MSHSLYFAYGSNLLTNRLVDRCPSAQYYASACVDDFALEFSKNSKKDGSGKATFIPSHGQRLYGAVFEMETSELEQLDRVESGYYREDSFKVCLVATGTSKTVKTYIAPEKSRNPDLKPFDWYLALIVAGAMEHKLPQTVISAYQNTRFWTDKEGKNKSDTLKLLRKAGFESIEQVLNLK